MQPIHPTNSDDAEQGDIINLAHVRHVVASRVNNPKDDVTSSDVDDVTTDEEEEQEKRVAQSEQRRYQTPVLQQKQKERKLVFLSETEAIYI